MPVESLTTAKRKLESNLAIYLKIAEREFTGKNFKVALKNFKNVNDLKAKINEWAPKCFL